MPVLVEEKGTQTAETSGAHRQNNSSFPAALLGVSLLFGGADVAGGKEYGQLSLTMTNRLELDEKAQLQLETVLAQTKARILADRDFGKNRETVLVGIKDEDHPDYSGCWAEVTFDPKAEYKSINNLGGQSQTFGLDDVILDSGMCQVVAVSQFRNKRIIGYEMVTGPPLPFSLGSSGAVIAGGNSVIGGVESAAVLADGLDRSKELVEGGVVANGEAGSSLPNGVTKVLTLRDQVEVVGVAQTTGGADTGPRVNLTRGRIKETTEREQLPKVDYRDYDPVSKGWQHSAHAEPVVTDGRPLYGMHRYSSPSGVTTFNADLVLNGALVYVDGDVVLNKKLSGSGALVASGKVTILGGADVKADSLAAVVAGGDLTVTGSRDSKNAIISKFTGLLYTDGNLALKDTQTIGSALAAGSGEVGSLMTITDSEVIASPEGEDVAIVIQDFVDPNGGGFTSRNTTKGAIVAPSTAEIIEHPDFRNSKEGPQLEAFARSMLRIRYDFQTFADLAELRRVATNQDYDALSSAYDDVLRALKSKIQKLELQGENIQVVRFDLNEFLNVNERLRSSQTFYLES